MSGNVAPEIEIRSQRFRGRLVGESAESYYDTVGFDKELQAINLALSRAGIYCSYAAQLGYKMDEERNYHLLMRASMINPNAVYKNSIDLGTPNRISLPMQTIVLAMQGHGMMIPEYVFEDEEVQALFLKKFRSDFEFLLKDEKGDEDQQSSDES